MQKCKQAFKANCCEHREEICCKKQEEYVLRAPNEGLVKLYVEGLLGEFLRNPETKLCLTLELCKQFKSYTDKLSNKLKSKTACRLAAKNLVHQILNLCKINAGKFLKHVREVNPITISGRADFGEPMHSVHSEPYYYDTAYLHSLQPTRLTINKASRCLSIKNMTPNSDEFVNNEPIPLDAQGRAHTAEGSAWSYACRTVSDDDVKVILDLKRAFENPIAQIREGLQNINNGCPHIHHLKPRGMDDGLACTEIFKFGHPLPCSSGMYSSKLRVLRAASLHYPVLQKLLHSVYMARKCHNTVTMVDSGLSTSDYQLLCNLVQVSEYENLIGKTVVEQDTDLPSSSENVEFSAEGLVGIERK